VVAASRRGRRRSAQPLSFMNYDEDEVLTDYVWRQCHTHFTDFEHMGWKAVQAREKAAAVESTRIKRMVVEKWAGDNDPNVIAALAQGVEAFRLAVRDRVLRDHPELINRCPQCRRIARTPRARQCRWCLYDWHS